MESGAENEGELRVLLQRRLRRSEQLPQGQRDAPHVIEAVLDHAPPVRNNECCLCIKQRMKLI
jgi:hypothetical protein